MLRPLSLAPYSVLILYCSSYDGLCPPLGEKTNSFSSLSEITILVRLLVLNLWENLITYNNC